ncbi:hypothetical protein BD779DRAFT_1786865 [Infundibulicybe gibba]|nr:hypothetical protein BD779DRAFT_1786865 [Infundibulicybe gibba]
MDLLGMRYIGGAVLVRFLQHPKFESFSITALARSSEKAERLKTLGINAVVSSHSDLQLIEKLASEAEFIFAMADANNMTAAQAILRGVKKRFETTGVAPKLINTRGIYKARAVSNMNARRPANRKKHITESRSSVYLSCGYTTKHGRLSAKPHIMAYMAKILVGCSCRPWCSSAILQVAGGVVGAHDLWCRYIAMRAGSNITKRSTKTVAA